MEKKTQISEDNKNHSLVNVTKTLFLSLARARFFSDKANVIERTRAQIYGIFSFMIYCLFFIFGI